MNVTKNDLLDSMQAAAIFTSMSHMSIPLHLAEGRGKKGRHGGLKPGRAANRDLGRMDAGVCLHNDYFIADDKFNIISGNQGSTFTKAQFEPRFRMLR